jgi:hypothetical protein
MALPRCDGGGCRGLLRSNRGNTSGGAGHQQLRHPHQRVGPRAQAHAPLDDQGVVRGVLGDEQCLPSTIPQFLAGLLNDSYRLPPAHRLHRLVPRGEAAARAIEGSPDWHRLRLGLHSTLWTRTRGLGGATCRNRAQGGRGLGLGVRDACARAGNTRRRHGTHAARRRACLAERQRGCSVHLQGHLRKRGGGPGRSVTGARGRGVGSGVHSCPPHTRHHSNSLTTIPGRPSQRVQMPSNDARPVPEWRKARMRRERLVCRGEIKPIFPLFGRGKLSVCPDRSHAEEGARTGREVFSDATEDGAGGKAQRECWRVLRCAIDAAVRAAACACAWVCRVVQCGVRSGRGVAGARVGGVVWLDAAAARASGPGGGGGAGGEGGGRRARGGGCAHRAAG